MRNWDLSRFLCEKGLFSSIRGECFGEMEDVWLRALNLDSVGLGCVPRVFTNVCLTGGKFTGRNNAQNLR